MNKKSRGCSLSNTICGQSKTCSTSNGCCAQSILKNSRNPSLIFKTIDCLKFEILNNSVIFNENGILKGTNRLTYNDDKATLKVNGLFEGYGVSFVPQSINPNNENTLWINNADGQLYKGSVNLQSTFDSLTSVLIGPSAPNISIGNLLSITNIAGNTHIAGKLTVDGLIDPTGLLLTAQVSNPSDPETLWINIADSHLYKGANDLEPTFTYSQIYAPSSFVETGTSGYIITSPSPNNTTWNYIKIGQMITAYISFTLVSTTGTGGITMTWGSPNIPSGVAPTGLISTYDGQVSIIFSSFGNQVGTQLQVAAGLVILYIASDVGSGYPGIIAGDTMEINVTMTWQTD